MARSDVPLITLPCFLCMQLLSCAFISHAFAIPPGFISPQDYLDYAKAYSSIAARPMMQSKRNTEPWMSLLTSAFLREAADHVGGHGYRGLRGKK